MLLVWGTRFGALVTLFRDVVYIATVIGSEGSLHALVTSYRVFNYPRGLTSSRGANFLRN